MTINDKHRHEPRKLEVFVPSNRKYRNGKPMGFVGLNDLIDAAKGSRFGHKEERIKFEAERHIASVVRKEMRRIGWRMPECRCDVHLEYVEPNAKRDPDNITGGGSKVVMDALCKPKLLRKTASGKEIWRHYNGCSALYDDDQKHVHLVAEVSDEYDKDKPGVWIRITERGD